ETHLGPRRRGHLPGPPGAGRTPPGLRRAAMDVDHAADALWAGIKRRQHLPAEWRGKLSLGQAYAVQLAILRKRIAEGEVQAGWKVGLTSAAMRAQQGVAEPCFGFLLRSGHLRS